MTGPHFEIHDARETIRGDQILQHYKLLRPPLTPVAVAVDLSAHALVTPIPQTLLAITVNREWLDYRWINFGDTIINQQGPRGNRSLICDNAQLLSLSLLSLSHAFSHYCRKIRIVNIKLKFCSQRTHAPYIKYYEPPELDL